MALKFILIKDKIGYDISDVVQKVTWSGRKNSPARSLQLQILDDPELGESNRTGIDVYAGNHIIFLEDNTELFRGLVMRQSRTQDRTLNIVAYDSAIYLANNMDCFKYKKKTLTNIFLDICKRFGISKGEVTQVSYKIPNLVQVNSTLYDLLCMAMSQTYFATGDRYYILSKGGQLHLLHRREQITKLVLETGQEGSPYGNLTNYSYSKDITNTRTRLKLISQKGKTITEWADRDLESKIGVMQDVQIPDDSLKKKKLKTMVVTMLDELKMPEENLEVTAFGISSIYSGMAVYISIPEIGIGRTFYVDADTHTWDGDYHTMRLTLNFATDLESINDAGTVEKSKAQEAAATKAAQELIKNAAASLKEKKAAEKQLINAGKAAEKASTAALKALASAKKAGSGATAQKYAKTVQEQSAKAQSEYEKAKDALTAVKALLNSSQSSLSSNDEFAITQAETSARKAADAAEEAKQYL